MQERTMYEDGNTQNSRPTHRARHGNKPVAFSSALGKGLSFVSTSQAKDCDTVIDFQKCFSGLRLTEFFGYGFAPYAPANVNLLNNISNSTGNSANVFPIDNLNDNEPDSRPEEMTRENTYFKRKSTFLPPKIIPSLEKYCCLGEKDEHNLLAKKKEYNVFHNMSKAEKESLMELKNDSSIIIPTKEVQ
jgi:hypothetical protein